MGTISEEEPYVFFYCVLNQISNVLTKHILQEFEIRLCRKNVTTHVPGTISVLHFAFFPLGKKKRGKKLTSRMLIKILLKIMFLQ